MDSQFRAKELKELMANYRAGNVGKANFVEAVSADAAPLDIDYTLQFNTSECLGKMRKGLKDALQLLISTYDE